MLSSPKIVSNSFFNKFRFSIASNGLFSDYSSIILRASSSPLSLGSNSKYLLKITKILNPDSIIKPNNSFFLTSLESSSD